MSRYLLFLAAVVLSATPGSADEDMKKGKALIKKWGCIECHGMSGNTRSASTREVPMLAGQPATFLAKRIAEYKLGKHDDLDDWSKMGTLVRGLSEKDITDISGYYAAQKRY